MTGNEGLIIFILAGLLIWALGWGLAQHLKQKNED